MAKFRFKLDAVLRYRRLIEEECQRELGAAFQERLRLQDVLRQMQQTIVSSKQQLGDGLVGQVDMLRVGHFARYAGQVRVRAQGIVVQMAGVEKLIESRREKLIQATKARKALELLRDRQHEQWRLEQERREATLLDEFATQGFLRSQEEEKTRYGKLLEPQVDVDGQGVDGLG